MRVSTRMTSAMVMEPSLGQMVLGPSVCTKATGKDMSLNADLGYNL